MAMRILQADVKQIYSTAGYYLIKKENRSVRTHAPIHKKAIERKRQYSSFFMKKK